MSHQIRGRHILGGIALAALVSLPFDAMIVSAVVTDIRMERAFRAADARAAKRAHDRAIADTVSAAPQPDQSALISRAQVETTCQAEEGSEESVLSHALRHTEAGETATSGVTAASRNPHPLCFVHAGPKRGVNQCVTLGRDRGFARSSSSSTLQGRVESAVVASAQGVRSVRSVSANVPEQSEAAGTGRSLLYEVTAYSHGCTLPRSGREPHAQRAANGRWPIADQTVAADALLHPFGSEVLIEGLGFRTVGDRGSAIKGRRLDLFVDSCREARAFGRRFLRVFPVPPATTREARGFDMEAR